MRPSASLDPRVSHLLAFWPAVGGLGQLFLAFGVRVLLATTIGAVVKILVPFRVP